MIAALLILLAGLVVLGGVVLIRWGDARAWRASLVTYKLTLPQTLTTADVAAWLAHVVATTHATRLAVRTPPALALEVTADSRGITHTLIVPKNLTGSVLAGLRATLPAARIEEKPRAVGAAYALAAEARLTSLLRPLAHDRAGLASTSILASLQPLGSGEQIALQWVFTGVPTPAPATTANTTLSADAARSARLKLAEPMLQAVVRLGVKADSQARAASLFGQVWGTLRSLNTPGAAIVRRHLPSSIVAHRLADLRLPLTRFPLTLNVKELAGLLAFPLGVNLPGLPRRMSRPS